VKLKGRVAIVTGAAKGIGRGTVCCLAEEGADVVIADIDMDNATRVAEEVKAFGRQALVVEADVSQKEEAELLVEKALSTFGKIDILVNNAAGSRPRPRPAGAPAVGGGVKITDLPTGGRGRR
jgi:NAD(P)-dependent dehydrogenase (short-subunit alcohol dehydrogenase family)